MVGGVAQLCMFMLCPRVCVALSGLQNHVWAGSLANTGQHL